MKPILVVTLLIIAAPTRSPAVETIKVGGTSARFDVATGRLTLLQDEHAFAAAEFVPPGVGHCTTETLDKRSPFGPGRLLRIGPGDNCVMLREGSRLALLRRDPRATTVTHPGHRVIVWQPVLELGVAAEKLKGIGPAGLFDPAINAGQHVCTAIADPQTRAGVVAALLKIDAASGVLLTKVDKGKITLTLRNDYGSAIPPQLAATEGDWWALGFFPDARRGLESYAEEFARINQLKIKPLPVGFMTWYCEKYGGALNETAVIELAGYLARTFKDFGYGFVQIDDLWQNGQRRNGPAKDFTRVAPNGPYRGGMQPVADQIHSLGLTPGLWLLPFAIDHQDPILAERVPLVVRTADGAPFESPWSGTALDLTLPEAREYVRGFIAQTVKDWGFDYLKLDGLHIGMATRQTYPHREYTEDGFGDAVFADRTMSNMQAGRAGLKAVREGAGPETFILGCCTPQNERSLGMVMGLVDAMRVGPDSSIRWNKEATSIVGGVRSAAALYFLNGRVWWNDPDSIYARARMPLNEVRCLASWVTVTGMLNNQTDWAPDYPPERVELLRRTMPSHQLTSVRPVDFFEHDPARVWILDYEIAGQQRHVVGLFNWDDQEIEIAVNFERLGLSATSTYAGFEFWSNTLSAPLHGEFSRRLPARSCQILALRDVVDRPVLLGTSRHITQGAVDLLEECWDESQQTLSGASRIVGHDSYELRIWAGNERKAPQHRRAVTAQVSPADAAAGVTIEWSQEASLVRTKILSPASRTVRWSLTFGS